MVYGVVGGRHDFEMGAEILTTPGLPVPELITHRFPLSDIRSAFAAAASKTDGVVRVVVGRTQADLEAKV